MEAINEQAVRFIKELTFVYQVSTWASCHSKLDLMFEASYNSTASFCSELVGKRQDYGF